MSTNYHLIHPHSSVVTDGSPKLPEEGRLEYGELAINYAAGHETISIKNDEDEIIAFPNNQSIQDMIDENEHAIANALVDLDTRVEMINGEIYDIDTVRNKANVAYDKSNLSYVKPSTGIPMTDLSSEVKTNLARIYSGQVDSTSTATAFTATISGITAYADGVAVYLRNGVIASAAAATDPKGFTLEINGLGAKYVYSTLEAATLATTQFNQNSTYLFIYNSTRVSGGCWDMYFGLDTDTDTIGIQVRTSQQTKPVSVKTGRYRLLFTSADGTKFVPANASGSISATAAKTVITTPIDPFGTIVCYYYTTVLSANTNPSTNYLFEQRTVGLGYSFNTTGASLTLTVNGSVYVKATPQANGSAIIDATTPIVQALPTTEDGKIYIFLGVATNAANIELMLNHPVYYYKDGAIRLWTNAVDTESTITQNSTKAITSGAVYSALYDNELVVSSALNQLSVMIENLQSRVALLESQI